MDAGAHVVPRATTWATPHVRTVNSRPLPTRVALVLGSGGKAFRQAGRGGGISTRPGATQPSLCLVNGALLAGRDPPACGRQRRIGPNTRRAQVGRTHTLQTTAKTGKPAPWSSCQGWPDMMSRTGAPQRPAMVTGAACPSRPPLALPVHTSPSLCAGMRAKQRHRIWAGPRSQSSVRANCRIPISILGFGYIPCWAAPPL